MLLVLPLIAYLDNLAPTVCPAAFADVVRAHKLATLRAWHQGRHREPLVLTPVAAAMARDFSFWYSTHVE